MAEQTAPRDRASERRHPSVPEPLFAAVLAEVGRCRAELADAEDWLRRLGMEPPALPDDALESVGLSLVSLKALTEVGFTRLGEVSLASAEWLRTLHGVGRNAENVLRYALARRGSSLVGEPVSKPENLDLLRELPLARTDRERLLAAGVSTPAALAAAGWFVPGDKERFALAVALAKWPEPLRTIACRIQARYPEPLSDRRLFTAAHRAHKTKGSRKDIAALPVTREEYLVLAARRDEYGHNVTTLAELAWSTPTGSGLHLVRTALAGQGLSYRREPVATAAALDELHDSEFDDESRRKIERAGVVTLPQLLALGEERAASVAEERKRLISSLPTALLPTVLRMADDWRGTLTELVEAAASVRATR